VDFDDFFLFANVFGTRRGDAKFDAKFDLDNNGILDFEDFFLFAADFGKKAGQTGGGGTKEVTVYIADLLGGRVEMINARDNLSVGTIQVTQPRGLAFSPDVSVLYVASTDTFRAFRADGKLDFLLPLPTGFKVAVSPDGQRAYVTKEGLPESDANSGVAIIDLKAKRQSNFIPLPGRPSGIVLTPNGQKAYVGNRTRRLIVLDLVKETPKDSILTTNAFPSRVALSPDGQTVYLSNGISDTINVVDTATDRVVKTFATKSAEAHLGSSIVDLAVSPDGKHLYASSFRIILALVPGSPEPAPTLIGELLSIDVGTGKVERILLGENAASLGISPDGKTAYVVSAQQATEGLEVTIVDLETKKAIGSLPVIFVQPVDIKFRTVVR
jgi:YVTN family beta-propeller protein